ncbi:MAG: photosystem II reaction center PsbP family protein [Gloeomargaritaceae cyanobacterium C42_A2020_066]|nr:photosystem II reaction center PsbP family protein [Gloeomargaritaceae cyanobacterium C42_A2020_066]
MVRLFLVVVCFLFTLTGCTTPGAGLNPYVNTAKGYEVLFPNGWVQVKPEVPGPDVVFHDLIDPAETLSVVISTVKSGRNLTELGSPAAVADRLLKDVLAPADSGRRGELLAAESRPAEDQTYYILEFLIQSTQGTRHNLAAVTTRRGQLYTVNVAAPEERWPKVEGTLRQAVNSFRVY